MRAKRLVRRLRAASRPTVPGVRLRIVKEAEALSPTTDATGAIDGPQPLGVLERAVGAAMRPADAPGVFNAVAGPVTPEWAQTPGGGLRFAVDVARVCDVHHAPAFGAVIARDGTVFHSPVFGATYVTPTLEALPGVRLEGGCALFSPPARTRHRDAASIFVPWGANHNYGHFLLDALPGLALLADRGLLTRFPPIAPRLAAAQQELLAAMLRPGEAVEQVDDPLIHVDDLLFTTCMDHFLHAPNTPLDSVRARIFTSFPDEGGVVGRRIYLTRRGHDKRRLVNEPALEEALAARGFEIVAPEDLTVRAQVALFRQTSVVVAATGAALANVLFVEPGAKVFELQPENYTGIWVRALAHFVGADWHGYFSPSPVAEEAVYIDGELRPGLSFSWRLPLDDFLLFLDRSLQTLRPSNPTH